MNAIREMLSDWPGPISIRRNRYETPEGSFPRVTSVLKVLGLGTEGLISWSAKSERTACLEACAEVFATESSDGPTEFAAAVESKLGAARAHQRLLAKAADIGTSIHQAIQWSLRGEMGEEAGPFPLTEGPALVGFMSWQDWRKTKRLKSVRVEQPVWDSELGYAGTIDWLAENLDTGVLEVWDWKSSKGVYETHHVQATSYVHAARRWAPVEPGGIVHLPKDINDPLTATEHKIGHLYGGKVVTQDTLMDAFRACLALYNTFMKEEK